MPIQDEHPYKPVAEIQDKQSEVIVEERQMKFSMKKIAAALKPEPKPKKLPVKQ